MTESNRPSIPEHARHGLESVAALHERTQQAVSLHHRVIEHATKQIGQPPVLYGIVIVAVLWMVWNGMGPRFGLPIIDPSPFPLLQCAVSVSALVLTTMVLTTQNRHARVSEARSHLDLQVSLLGEKRTAKIIELVEELRRDLPNVKNRVDPVANDLTKPVDPSTLVEAIERTIVDETVKKTDEPEE
jgi:uncharacterized membrane protein